MTFFRNFAVYSSLYISYILQMKDADCSSMVRGCRSLVLLIVRIKLDFYNLIFLRFSMCYFILPLTCTKCTKYSSFKQINIHNIHKRRCQKQAVASCISISGLWPQEELHALFGQKIYYSISNSMAGKFQARLDLHPPY